METQKRDNFMGSKKALEYLTNTNNKWFNHKLKSLFSNLFFLLLIVGVGYVVINIAKQEGLDLESLERFPFNSIPPGIFVLFMIIGIILVYEIIRIIFDINKFFFKALKYKRKGVENKKIYYDQRIEGYTPFKEDVFGAKYPRIIPIESIEELPEKFPKNTLYFCNKIPVVIISETKKYTGMVSQVKQIGEPVSFVFWHKTKECLSEWEKDRIYESFATGVKYIRGLIKQVKTKKGHYFE